MSIRSAFTKTTTDALSTVSAVSTSFSTAATTISDGIEGIGAHVTSWKKTTIAELNFTEQEFEDITRERARYRIARARKALDDELKTDPGLAAYVKAVSFRDEKPTAPTNVHNIAAE